MLGAGFYCFLGGRRAIPIKGKPKLVVIGNGMAGVKCVEEICEAAPDRYDITIFGSEPRPNYNRIMLSKVLQGDASLSDIVIHDWNWYESRGIALHAGHPVARIDAQARMATTTTGIVAAYDRLILATGSSAYIPPLPGVGKPGVIGFRSVDDCEKMMEAAASFRKAAVIGGGLLGLEAARGLLNLGMDVTVVHNAPYLMNRQLDGISAEMLHAELTKQGMKFLFGKSSERILGRKRAEGVAFSDGTKLQADLIVMAVGIRPNVELAKSAGIRTNRAFVVNDRLETSVPGIYAVGECAEHDGTVYGLVAPLYEQGKVLAKVLCGLETEPYRGSVPYAQLKVSGVDVFSAGDVNGSEHVTMLQQYDGLRRTYKRVTAKSGKVAGAILFGDIGESAALLGLLKRGADATALERVLGRPEDGGPSGAAAALADSETVCQCNGVSKAAILGAVREGGLSTTEQVRDRTKASGSCGGCKPMVAALVKLALAGDASLEAEAEPAMCGCTKLGHGELKKAVAGRGFASVGQAMAELGWSHPEGCGDCRAAIGYYLGLEAAENDTGGSNVVVGPGRGTDGGSLVRVGLELERNLRGLPLPYPVTISVASAADERSGWLVRDFGVAEAPAGWEIYAGGSVERPVAQAKLLVVAASEEEALELVVSCVQGYRESARYGESVCRWLDRMGTVAVRERLLDPDERERWLDGWREDRRRRGCRTSWQAANKGGDRLGEGRGIAYGEADAMSVLQRSVQDDAGGGRGDVRGPNGVPGGRRA